MANIAAFLFGLVAPFAKKAMIALGFASVTFVGFDAIISNISNSVIFSVGGMTGASAQVAAILGFQTSLGILLAALTTRLSLVTLTRWMKT